VEEDQDGELPGDPLYGYRQKDDIPDGTVYTNFLYNPHLMQAPPEKHIKMLQN
jgi:hypothetical protein